MRLLGIHHIALNVRHLDRAEGFYTDVLGFKVSQRFSKGLRHLMLDAGNSQIALFEVPDLEIELMRLEREVEIQSKLYAFLTQQYEESKIQEARDTPTIQILDGANIPIKRHQPKRTLMVIGYSLIAFILSSLYIIFIKFYENDMSGQMESN